MSRLRLLFFGLSLGAILLLVPIVRTRYHTHALTGAVERSNLPEIKRLVQGGADVNTRSRQGWTSLILAAGAGDLAFVKQLIARDARVNEPANGGGTPLYTAAKAGHLEVVRELLESGAVPYLGETLWSAWGSPRAAAKRAGHQEIARLLAEREKISANLLKETQEQWTNPPDKPDPKRLERWRRLLEQGANPNANNANGDSLMALVAAGDSEGLQLLLSHGWDPTLSSRFDADLVCVAADAKSPILLETLIQHGARVEGCNPFRTPLGTAVLSRRLENARFLLAHGADPSRKSHGQSLLHWAKDNRDAPMVELLEQNGAPP